MEATQTSHNLTLKKRSICYASPRSFAATHPLVRNLLPRTRSGLGFVVARPPVCCCASVATNLLPTVECHRSVANPTQVSPH
ncbi:hypothetical protein AB3S75_017997 [Citrus x aurantiifolia]